MIVMTEEQAMKLAKEILGMALEVDEFRAMDCAHQVIILGYAIYIIGASSMRATEGVKEMSKAKDRERAQAGILVRNTEERIVKEEDKDFSDGWKCFLCNSPISKGEGGKLEAYAHKKPKFVINKEMGKMNNLLAGHDSRTSRICKKCYKDRVER